MAANPDAPSRARALATGVVRALVHSFFHRVEVVGLEHVPAQGGGVVVSWHPNGMVDPALIVATFPRALAFGARAGLFAWPGLGALMRALGTVPIRRVADDPAAAADPARRAANRQSLDELARAVSEGSFAALFPEGASHDAPHLLPLRTGAARIYYRARALAGSGAGPAPVILPVGLFYDHKHSFRSDALVVFHPPLVLPAALDVLPAEEESEESEEASRERAEALTGEIECALKEAVQATVDWNLYRLMHRAAQVVRCEHARRAGLPDPGTGLAGRTLELARIHAGYYARLATHPAEVRALRRRLRGYDRDLSVLGLEDGELDRDPPLVSRWMASILALQALTVFLLLPPIVLLGFAVNLPTALGLWALSTALAKQGKDVASIKVLLGALAFPATWVVAGLAAARAHEQLEIAFPALPTSALGAGFLTAALAALGGAVGMRYLRVAGRTARSLRVRITRRARGRALDRLRFQRGRIYDELLRLGQGLELPSVLPGGG